MNQQVAQELLAFAKAWLDDFTLPGPTDSPLEIKVRMLIARAEADQDGPK